MLLNNWDLDSDFYNDSQIKLIFKEELASIPSSIMWALMLYHHPDSKYYQLEPHSKLALIEKDYLKASLDLSLYSETIAKIELFTMSKTKRLLKNWEDDLEERDAFMKSLPYNETNFEIKEKLLSNRLKLWEQYLVILKKVQEEEESQSFGDVELSLTERGLID